MQWEQEDTQKVQDNAKKARTFQEKGNKRKKDQIYQSTPVNSRVEAIRQRIALKQQTQYFALQEEMNEMTSIFDISESPQEESSSSHKQGEDHQVEGRKKAWIESMQDQYYHWLESKQTWHDFVCQCRGNRSQQKPRGS